MAQQLLRVFFATHGFGFWTTSTVVFLVLLLAGHFQVRRARRDRLAESRLRLEIAWQNTVAALGTKASALTAGVAGPPKIETILQTEVSCDI